MEHIGSLVQTTAGLVVLAGIGVVVMVIARRQVFSRREEDVTFREFSPGELERLKQKGLLNDEEAKRLQSLVAHKSMENLERLAHPREEKVDMDSLLAEATRLKMSKQTSEKSTPEARS